MYTVKFYDYDRILTGIKKFPSLQLAIKAAAAHTKDEWGDTEVSDSLGDVVMISGYICGVAMAGSEGFEKHYNIDRAAAYGELVER